MRKLFILLTLGVAIASPAKAAELNPEAINAAAFTGKMPTEEKATALAVKAQVLLDRAHFSPGEIDGLFGDNVEKALRAFAEANQLPSDKVLTAEIWARLDQGGSAAIVGDYTLTDEDVKGPYLDKLPAKMEDMAPLKRLAYTGPKEMLAERFHMSSDLLVALNPKTKFDRAGEVIKVLNLAEDNPPAKVTRVEVDKARQTVKAFADNGALVAFYPASVGSEEKPTPSGTLKVVTVQANPTYRYNPKYRFKGVSATKPFTVRPGPNNPVGVMWIGLSEAGYGLHGTAEPSRVSKSESHGCVRLTNWDVQRLARLVKKGIPVEFIEGKQASR